MTNQLKWRLGKLPTSDEVLKLVNDKIITKEEAREILFNEEIPTERDKESLEQEIKFLREMVDKLAKGNRSAIIEVIKEVQVPYYHHYWTTPYIGWTTGTTTLGGATSGTAGAYDLTLTTGTSNATCLTGSTSINCAFTDINTF